MYNNSNPAPSDFARTYDCGAIVAGGGTLPKRDAFSFSNPLSRIRCVTIYNQSNCLVGMFTEGGNATNPDFLFPPTNFATMPVAACGSVWVSILPPNGGPANGKVYVHILETTLTANSGIIPGVTASNVLIWDSGSWDSGSVWGG